MSAKRLAKDSYSSLLKQIRQEIAQGLERAQQAYNREKVGTYWKIGQAIAQHLLAKKSRADYGKQLYSRLSRDLGVSERLLYQISQFYNTYPDLKPSQNLNWSHYRLLTSIKDKNQRNIIEARALDDNWSKRDLENFLKEEREKNVGLLESKAKRSRKLSSLKGKLYIYGVFKDDYADNLLIDCGFNIYHESDIKSFQGKFAKTVKTENGYKLIETKATHKQLYTYKAYVKKIIDGDTLWVIVDCGFRIWSSQKIRLRGIDTAGITTPKGLEAYKFVCRKLKGLPFIIIKSYGRDKYDRYLADIFYLRKEDDPQVVLERGEFLNQRLLDKGLAVYHST